MDAFQEEEWPKAAEKMYERIEVLGKGSFGLVWMCQRRTKPKDEFDDEFVALKNIEIKEEKGKVYAQREISILSELKHPNVIRLIRAFPVYNDISRLVALQLARGPNLQRVVGKRGAVGLPLSRLISRELVAAVSYLHGRGVLHRDIKPTNLILENTEINTVEYYDYGRDSSIWSDGPDAEAMVKRNKWRVMLVDFGFARALEASEVYLDDDNDDYGSQKRKEKRPKRHMRNSITLENKGPKKTSTVNMSKELSQEIKNSDAIATAEKNLRNLTLDDADADINIDKRPKRRTSNVSNMNEIRNLTKTINEVQDSNEESDELGDLALIHIAAKSMRNIVVEEPNPRGPRRRISNVLANIIPENEEAPDESEVSESSDVVKPPPPQKRNRRRISLQKVRSMSALGTKAYAAPEIKNQLRNKTTEDHEKTNAALTECVADYGMIVDAYSVGWTLRVVLTGVPPNSTISKYMRKYDGQEASMDFNDEVVCCCPSLFGGSPVDNAQEVKKKPKFRVRDTDEMPREATLFISALTKKDPEQRMSIRQAQLHPWIRGDEDSGEPPYIVPQGDYPSHHGDPVVPLQCAADLTTAVEQHNYNKN